MPELKRRILLHTLRQPALIVKAPTGLIYTNQTGGVACHHPEQEGFLVLLSPGAREQLPLAFSPGRWYDEMPALDDTLYDEIEEALNRKNLYPTHVRNVWVNRRAQNEEAWIHVRFRGDFDSEWGAFKADVNHDPAPAEEFPEYEAILTWENCD